MGAIISAGLIMGILAGSPADQPPQSTDVFQLLAANRKKLNNLYIDHELQTAVLDGGHAGSGPGNPQYYKYLCKTTLRDDEITVYREADGANARIVTPDGGMNLTKAVKWSNIGGRVSITYFLNERNVTKNVNITNAGRGSSDEKRRIVELCLGLGLAEMIKTITKCEPDESGYRIEGECSFWPEDAGSFQARIGRRGLIRSLVVHSNVAGNLHRHVVECDNEQESDGLWFMKNGSYRCYWLGQDSQVGNETNRRQPRQPMLKEEVRYAVKSIKCGLSNEEYRALTDMSVPNDTFIIDRVEKKRIWVDSSGKSKVVSYISDEPLVKPVAESGVWTAVILHGVLFTVALAGIGAYRRLRRARRLGECAASA
jgi:hypothetical protein